METASDVADLEKTLAKLFQQGQVHTDYHDLGQFRIELDLAVCQCSPIYIERILSSVSDRKDQVQRITVFFRNSLIAGLP
ncbi:MAG: hypothetical protein V4689_12975 [Verrucomicrobiota bacterium]